MTEQKRGPLVLTQRHVMRLPSRGCKSFLVDKAANAAKATASTASASNDQVAVSNASCEAIGPAPRTEVSPDSQRGIRKIRVADIIASIDSGVDPKNVAILAESFRQSGQTAAILVVREDKCGYRVISGNHRLAAANELGWDQIDAAVLDCDGRSQRLIKIAENRHRRDLPVLERAELDHEWIELVRQEAVQVARPIGGRQPKDLGLSKAARALGLTREGTRRSYRIASVSPEAKTKATELGFDNNQAILLQVAKLTSPDAQIALLLEIFSERKNEPRKYSVTQNTIIEEVTEPSAVSTSATVAQALKGFQENDSVVAMQQQEDAPSASAEPY